jgi:hypothetical protein
LIELRSVITFAGGINHKFGNETVKPFLEAGGGFSILKKIDDSGFPERNSSTLPMLYGKTGGSVTLNEQLSLTAGIRYNRIFRNPDYEFLTFEGGLSFSLK